MNAIDIQAMTDPCRLGEWRTRGKSYPPQVAAPKGQVGHRVDHSVKRLRSRWVYALVHGEASGGAFSIPFEAFVDAFGFVWFHEDLDPNAPIPDRPDPRDGGFSTQYVQFPKVNELGNALSTRLLFSPFRLPSAAMTAVNEAGYHKSIIQTIPPLWTWTRGIDLDSPVISADDYSLVVEPLWMKFQGESTATPVFVGSDPFKIAENRSNLYIRRRNAYAEVFEPNDDAGKRTLSRMMLGEALTDTILRPTQSHEKYAKTLDVARLNEELSDFDDQRVTLQKQVNKSGKNLCRYLEKDVFALLQYASLEEETYEEGQPYCQATADHLRVLDVVTRQLDRCEAGCELLMRWGRDASESDHHFLSQTVLPSRPLGLHVFRTMRWGGKGALNLFRKLGPWLLSRKSDVFKAAGEMLVAIGAVEKVDIVAKSIRMLMGEIAAAFKTKLRGPSSLVVKVIGKRARAGLEAFAKQGKVLFEKAAPEFRTSKFVAFAALDAINAIIALRAISDAEGPGALARAGSGAGAACGFLAMSVAKPVVEAMEDGTTKTRWLRGVHVVTALCAGVYAVLDFIAASDAWDKDDRDRAAMLVVAGVAEAASCATYAYLAWTGATGGAVLLLVLGTVAALAYIAALLTEDDPLQEFLENCEWGATPYARPHYHPEWADKPVAVWAGDYELQLTTLLRLLARFTLSWDLKSWPDVELSTSLIRTGMRFEVEFVAEYADGSTGTVERHFGAADLPSASPIVLLVSADQAYLAHSARTITVKATYRADVDAKEEVLEAEIMKDGKAIEQGKKTRVA